MDWFELMGLLIEWQDQHPEHHYRIKGNHIQRQIGKIWRKICRHHRRRSRCRDCGGASICVHNRERHRCRDCGGSSICVHNRRRSRCRDCGGVSICVHNRRRSQCRDCGGSSICVHNRERRRCRDCGGSSICVHNRRRSSCGDCHPCQNVNQFGERCPSGASSVFKMKLCLACGHTLHGTTPRERTELKVFARVSEFLEDCNKKNIEYTVYYDLPDPLACNQNRRRADIRIILPHRFIIIEVDERQHNAVSYSCTMADLSKKGNEVWEQLKNSPDQSLLKQVKEDARMSEMVVESQTICPIVFIRFNPDHLKDEEGKKRKISLTSRMDKLIEELEHWMHPEVSQDHWSQVVFLFYDGPERRADFVPISPEELKAKIKDNSAASALYLS